MQILAIDPGQAKCGLAVLTKQKILFQKVVERKHYLEELASCLARYEINYIILGDGTGAEKFSAEIKADFPTLPIILLDEAYTSEEARKRYWQVNPPQGWRRLLPTSLQLPPVPYDDFVAVILGERFLAEK